MTGSTRKSIYLVNPTPGMASYYGAEIFEHHGFAPAMFMSDLALPTVAAMALPYMQVEICDEYVQPVELEHGAGIVGLTGKITQWPRMRELAAAYRQRGKLVVIGGPYATLSPETVRPHCDVLVRGELETVADDLFADLAAGRPREEYVGGKADLARSPVPAWHLYPNDRALMGLLQTSRGCPFDCEFCDVIAYLGRHQRHKPPERVLEELDVLYGLGYRSVFLADDNFTVYRARTKELLQHMARWNRSRPDGRVSFGTQLSIDVTRDSETLELCREAGMKGVFVGIETPNEESLRETHKRQNLKVNMLEEVGALIDHGMQVSAGLIVGFDHDDPGIFERQYEFAMALPVPVLTVGALVAPEATPLHRRLQAAGRLVESAEVAGIPWATNVVPERMTRDELFLGLRWLVNNLYHPKAFAHRAIAFMEALPRPAGHGQPSPARIPDRPIYQDYKALIESLPHAGKDEAAMVKELNAAVQRLPHAASYVPSFLLRYCQMRLLFQQGGIWEPRIAGTPCPVTSAASAAGGARHGHRAAAPA